MNRRDFLRRGGVTVAAASFGTLSWATVVEPHWLEVVERDMPIAALPQPLHGRRLVQISDLHVGPRVSDAYLRECLQQVRALQPDILAITGDLVTWRGEHQLSALRALMRDLPHGALATVAVLGNHDYGPGWRDAGVATSVARELRDAGVTVLANSAVHVDGLALAGAGDLWAGECAPRTAAERADGAPAVMLCHNPDALDAVGWGEFRGWILSGHTHGGQCRPPFLPPPILPVRNRRYTAGEIQVAGGRRLYINRGLGHMLRARFNVRPEITAFTLVPDTFGG